MHRATFEVNFKKDQQPSSKMITQLAQTAGLEETSVNRWFKRQRYTKTWVSIKLEDPKYKENVSKTVKEAMDFINKFEKTRKDLGHSLQEVAHSVNTGLTQDPHLKDSKNWKFLRTSW